MIRTVAMTLTALMSGCQTGPGSAGVDPSEYIASVHPGGKSVVCVIDISLSMQQTDPRRFNEQGPQLAAVMASSTDNVGAISFDSDAGVLFKLQQLADNGRRALFRSRTTDLERKGQTNYIEALRTASRMLFAGDAPRGTTVIYLTDGEHTVGGPEENVLKELTPFIQKGWKIVCVGLGFDAPASRLLREIAVRTEGAFYAVTNAEDLIEAFLEITAQVFGLVQLEGGLRPVQIPPGIRKLVCLTFKGRRDSKLARLTLDGALQDLDHDPSIYRYPLRSDPAQDFEAVAVERPAPGRWEVGVHGPARRGIILCRPDFTIGLEEGFPRGEYYEGEVLEFALRIQGPPDLMERVRRDAKARAVLVTEEGRHVATVNLDPAAEAPFLFRGEMSPPTVKGDLEGILRFGMSLEDGRWTHEKRVSIRIHEGRRPTLVEVTPAKVELGTLWGSPEGVRREFAAKHVGSGRATVHVRALNERIGIPEPDFRVDDRGKSFAIHIPTDVPGTFSDTLVFGGAQEGGLRVTVPPVPVTWKVLILEGAESIPPQEVQQGKEFRLPFDVRLAGGGELQVEVEALRGPGGVIEARLVEEGERRWVTGNVSGETPAGDYEGVLTLSVPGEDAPARTFPLTLRVREAVPQVILKTPKLDVNAATPGWAEAPLDFEFEFIRGVDVVFRYGDLIDGQGGKIDGEFRQKFRSATGDWDGRRLGTQGSYRGRYQVSISNDLRPGVYAGKMVVQIKDGARTFDAAEIPITVTYRPE
ncbi:MAG: VWA domain-containing protein [Planctomycetes bacterium]|nr:VWA domain-containing protein [Planctomycetota bacterium]